MPDGLLRLKYPTLDMDAKLLRALHPLFDADARFCDSLEARRRLDEVATRVQSQFGNSYERAYATARAAWPRLGELADRPGYFEPAAKMIQGTRRRR